MSYANNENPDQMPHDGVCDLDLHCLLIKGYNCTKKTQSIKESANLRFLQKLSITFGFRRDCRHLLLPVETVCVWYIASCRDCPCDLASCRESRQEAESHGQSLQKAIFRGRSLDRKQEIMDSLGGSQI